MAWTREICVFGGVLHNSLVIYKYKVASLIIWQDEEKSIVLWGYYSRFENLNVLYCYRIYDDSSGNYTCVIGSDE